jgi:hypothetical protein
LTCSRAASLDGRSATESSVDASLVVIGGESIQLAMEVDAVPEEGLIEILAPNGSFFGLLAEFGEANIPLQRVAPKLDALIDRMGSPNEGAEVIAQRRRFKEPCGINIGKNATTPLEAAARNYMSNVSCVGLHADYVPWTFRRSLRTDCDWLCTCQGSVESVADAGGGSISFITRAMSLTWLLGSRLSYIANTETTANCNRCATPSVYSFDEHALLPVQACGGLSFDGNQPLEKR